MKATDHVNQMSETYKAISGHPPRELKLNGELFDLFLTELIEHDQIFNASAEPAVIYFQGMKIVKRENT